MIREILLAIGADSFTDEAQSEILEDIEQQQAKPKEKFAIELCLINSYNKN